MKKFSLLLLLLTYAGPAFAGAGPGITQLTGNVSAGPGGGAQAATVTGASSAPFTVTGTTATPPGTVSVSGTTVTGVGTAFTQWFKPGDTITTTTTSGPETQTISTISSDTSMASTSFSGTNTGAVYLTSNGGVNQWSFFPNGTLRPFGSSVNQGNIGSYELLYLNNTVQYSGLGTITYRAIDLSPTISANVSGGGLTSNTIRSAPSVYATNGANIANFQAANFAPQIGASNTGNVSSMIGFIVSPIVNSGATGAISSLIGTEIAPSNSSAMTVTNYAGFVLGASPSATNSTNILVGTTTIPSGTYGIYENTSAKNYLNGPLQLPNYGAGTATFDASGNITSASDERLKFAPDGVSPVKLGSFRGSVLGIRPILHRWRPESGMETEHIYAGFSAQDVQKHIPEAVGRQADGMLTLQDRALLAAAVNDINRLYLGLVLMGGLVLALATWCALLTDRVLALRRGHEADAV